MGLLIFWIRVREFSRQQLPSIAGCTSEHIARSPKPDGTFKSKQTRILKPSCLAKIDQPVPGPSYRQDFKLEAPKHNMFQPSRLTRNSSVAMSAKNPILPLKGHTFLVVSFGDSGYSFALWRGGVPENGLSSCPPRLVCLASGMNVICALRFDLPVQVSSADSYWCCFGVQGSP